MTASGSSSRDTVPTQLADQLARCIRCGLCLPACPTYDVFRTEMDAPRGRLMLMRAVWEDPAAARGAAGEHLDLCLGCLSCETACPSGVEYGELLHATRERMEETVSRRSPRRLLRRLLVGALGHRALLHGLSWVLSVKQRLGLLALGKRLPWPGLLGRMVRLLPDGPRRGISRFRPTGEVMPPTGELRGRVALFRGCVQDAFLGRVHDATVRVLRRHGFEVHVPAGQTCCGAAAQHLAESDLARRLARRNLAAFEAADYDAIVNNAGGCGAMLSRYPDLFAPESDDRVRAERFGAKVRDLSEVLDAATDGATPDGPPQKAACRAVYADSCHLRHAQGVVEPPRELLRRIPGLELAELERPDHCCGSAGVYNLTQGDTADRLLARKLDEIEATGAEVVVTTNPGCQLQLLAGVRRAGLTADVVHLAELLDRSYGNRAATD